MSLWQTHSAVCVMNYNIRHATEKDLSALCDIEHESDKIFSIYHIPAITLSPKNPVSYWFPYLGHATLRIAISDTKILGFYLVTEIDGQAYLKQISVRPDHHQKGIGKALLQDAFLQAQQRGYIAMTLTTYRDIPFNAPLYQKYGFIAFVPDHTWPELSHIRKDEQSSDLEIRKRCAMIKELI
jgi:ribosomal protein S18 acetylase RimI-like enzyme